MKWFFAYNGHRSFDYDTHIEVMIRSAMANTSLDAHLIYFGRRDNPILSFAEQHGVKVIHHEPSIFADLQRIKAKFPDYVPQFAIATGAFLRIDVPVICRDLGYSDEFVLYTDCDVVFLRDIPEAPTHSFLRPTLFSCAPEFSETDWVNINSGVMVMNVVNLLDDYPSFRDFITAGDTLYYELGEGAFDQKSYLLHYASKWDKLPVEYNWKPYWGFNQDAVIVHFHGPKIPQVRDIMKGKTTHLAEILTELFERDPESYRDYFAYVDEYASD
jgi:hypothetical protein